MSLSVFFGFLAMIAVLMCNTFANRLCRYWMRSGLAQHELNSADQLISGAKQGLYWTLPASVVLVSIAIFVGLPWHWLPYAVGVSAFMTLHSLFCWSSTWSARRQLSRQPDSTAVSITRRYMRSEEVRLLLWIESWGLWFALSFAAWFMLG
jgi:hypothetical protein